MRTRTNHRDMNNVKPLGQFIANHLEAQRMSIREFASKHEGLSYSQLSRAMYEKPPKPSMKFMVAVAEATHTPLITILQLAYPELKIREPDRETQIIAERIAGLPEEKRKQAKAFLDFLVSTLL